MAGYNLLPQSFLTGSPIGCLLDRWTGCDAASNARLQRGLFWRIPTYPSQSLVISGCQMVLRLPPGCSHWKEHRSSQRFLCAARGYERQVMDPCHVRPEQTSSATRASLSPGQTVWPPATQDTSIIPIPPGQWRPVSNGARACLPVFRLEGADAPSTRNGTSGYAARWRVETLPRPLFDARLFGG